MPQSTIRARKRATDTIAASDGNSLSSHTQCASVRAAITPILRMKIGTFSHTGGQWTSNSGFMGAGFKLIYHAGLKEWSAKAKMRRGVGGDKQKAESKESCGDGVGRGANTSSRSCSPRSAPGVARRRQKGRRAGRLHFLRPELHEEFHFLRPELHEEFQNSLGCPGGTHR